MILITGLQLSGCSAPTPSRALQARGVNESEVCGSSATDSRFTVGLQWFVNQGPAPVTVTAVRWLNLSGLSQVQYRVAHPAEPNGGIGIVSGSPPVGKATDSSVKLWKASTPLLGATLPAAGEENPLQVLIGFEGTDGSAGPLEIDFTDGDGRSGTARSLLTKVEVKHTC